MPGPSRKDLLVSLLTTTAAAALPSAITAAVQTSTDITLEDLRAAAKVAGVSFTEAELKAIVASVKGNRDGANGLRGEGLPNDLEAAFRFVPLGGGSVPGKISAKAGAVKIVRARLTDEDIAFLSVAELGHLLKTRSAHGS